MHEESHDWKRQRLLESSCSARELAKLCCGWDPDSDVLPDPAAYNVALEEILRAVRVGDLDPVALRVPATRDELFYGDGTIFTLRSAATWAMPRYAAFPLGESKSLKAPTIEKVTAPSSEEPPFNSPLRSDLPIDGTGDSVASEIIRRLLLLENYKRATGEEKNAPIYRAVHVFGRDFYGWQGEDPAAIDHCKKA